MPPFALAIIAIAVVVGVIALIVRGGDEPSASGSAAADPVIPQVSEADIVAAAQQLGPRDQELVDIGRTGVSINRAGGGRKYVALTFDDGPGPDTPAVLAELKKAGVPATFFVIGRNVKANPEVLRQVVADGHEVGIHTWNHPDMTTLKPAQQKAEIENTAGEVLAVAGTAGRLFRAPYGAVDPSVLKRAEDSKLLSVLWDVDTQDWNDFLAVREDLYLRFMDAVKEAGTGFAFPSSTEWEQALREAHAASGRLGIVTCYAWNEFGEGGILAPTLGRG